MTKKASRNLRGRLEDGTPNPVDVHVGSRVRLRRVLLGMSQKKLGEAIGLTFQQVQKYERGADRIGASRLFDISRVLNVPVSFFYDDMGDGAKASSPAAIAAGATAIHGGHADIDHRTKRQSLEMMRAYHRIGNPQVRKSVFELVKAIASGQVDLLAAE